MGVGTERLELRIEPLGEPFGIVQRGVAIEAAGDDEPRHLGHRARIDGDAGDHLASGRSGLVRLLTEEMLDAQDVRRG